METRICYRYDENTKEFIGTDMAFQEPIGKTFPLPANCTFIEPPKTDKFEASVFEGGEWVVKKDYRKHLQEGVYVGEKPFFDPSNFWWADEQYMTSIGDIPEDMSFEKMEKPQIALDIVKIEEEITQAKAYLSDTDYVHNVIAEEPEKAEKYSSVIDERKKIRATIDPLEERMNALKEQIVALYGEEALNHLN